MTTVCSGTELTTLSACNPTRQLVVCPSQLQPISDAERGHVTRASQSASRSVSRGRNELSVTCCRVTRAGSRDLPRCNNFRVQIVWDTRVVLIPLFLLRAVYFTILLAFLSSASINFIIIPSVPLLGLKWSFVRTQTRTICLKLLLKIIGYCY